MNGKCLIGAAAAVAIVLSATASQARVDDHDVYWRIDPSVKTCSMVIDPSLTQSQWHKFAKEAGAILSLKSLASAQALGKGNFILGATSSSTPVDQHDLGWVNTFVHPDEDCPLGDAVKFPTARARVGVSDHLDVGGYWTTAPDANYGGVGGEIKYAFVQESENRPAAAVRGSFSLLTGVPDFNLGVYSIDLTLGKRVARFAPYIGLRESLIVGTETTSKVELDRETVVQTQGYGGMSFSVWIFDLAAEYDVSSVNTFAVALGLGRLAR